MDDVSNIKTTSKEALRVLDECIVIGYKLKERINREYFSNRSSVDQNIQEWRKDVDTWSRSTLDKLQAIFTSEAELYSFRDARPSPFVKTDTNIHWNSIINILSARIEKLEESIRFIRSINQANLQHEKVVVAEQHINISNSQLHSGSGNNIAGDKTGKQKQNLFIKYWWGLIIPIVAILIANAITQNRPTEIPLIQNSVLPVSPTAQQNLPMSVYDLRKQIRNMPGTSLDHDLLFGKYLGLIASDSGYIQDVDGGGVFIEKEIGSDILLGDVVLCSFSNIELPQSVAALQLGQKVHFKGVIDSLSLGTTLRECTIEPN